HHRQRICQVIPLEAADSGIGHYRAEIRVLARALDYSTPARVAGDVDHRRERPVESVGRRLDGRNPGRLLYRLRIPRCRLGQWNRKLRPETVDDVVSKNER